MATKKTTYIDIELDWAESQLAQWKDYIDANPIPQLKERVVYKSTKGGGSFPTVSETIGQQIKTLTDLMEKYLRLLKEVDSMREKEAEKKISKRGDAELTPIEEGIL